MNLRQAPLTGSLGVAILCDPLRRNLFLSFLYAALFLAFLAAADANYRSADGRLGQVPLPYQKEIVAGTAPAPYVYRQAVPRLQGLLLEVLLPGHAAVALDALFAILALVSGTLLARWALGRELGPWGAILATFACVAAYQRGFPEAIAGVAVPLTIVALLVHGRDAAAAALTGASAFLRPEIPVLLGTGMAVAGFVERGSPRARRLGVAFGLAAAVGLAYLLAARFVLWPDAPYTEAPPLDRLGWNLLQPIAWPGGMLLLLMASLGLTWLVRPDAPEEERVLQRGMGLFTLLYAGVLVLITFLREVRLFMPLLSPLVLLGMRWGSRRASP